MFTSFRKKTMETRIIKNIYNKMNAVAIATEFKVALKANRNLLPPIGGKINGKMIVATDKGWCLRLYSYCY